MPSDELSSNDSAVIDDDLVQALGFEPSVEDDVVVIDDEPTISSDETDDVPSDGAVSNGVHDESSTLEIEGEEDLEAVAGDATELTELSEDDSMSDLAMALGFEPVNGAVITDLDDEPSSIDIDNSLGVDDGADVEITDDADGTDNADEHIADSDLDADEADLDAPGVEAAAKGFGLASFFSTRTEDDEQAADLDFDLDTLGVDQEASVGELANDLDVSHDGAEQLDDDELEVVAAAFVDTVADGDTSETLDDTVADDELVVDDLDNEADARVDEDDLDNDDDFITDGADVDTDDETTDADFELDTDEADNGEAAEVQADVDLEADADLDVDTDTDTDVVAASADDSISSFFDQELVDDDLVDGDEVVSDEGLIDLTTDVDRDAPTEVVEPVGEAPAAPMLDGLDLEAPSVDPELLDGDVDVRETAPEGKADGAVVAAPVREVRRRRPRRRKQVRARKARRVVRHVDPWSVLTFSVLFHLAFFAAMLLASVLVWNAAVASGTLENIENFITELGDYENFEINGDVVFRSAVIIAGMLTLASSVMVVLLTVVFNLISDLIGGIRITVIEEETVRIPDTKSRGKRRKTADV